MVTVFSNSTPWRILKTFFKAITMQIHPKRLINNPIAATTEASPLDTPMLLSLLLTLTILQTHPPLLLPPASTTALAINLALDNKVMPVYHGYVTNMVSAKTLTKSNGLNEKCTIPPQGLKWPKILTPCANIHTFQNLVRLLIQQHAHCIRDSHSSYHADN